MYTKLFTVLCYIDAAVAITKFSHGYLSGYYCTSDYFKTITNISQHICTLICMASKSCFVIAYQQQRHICSLGETPCVIAKPHQHYMTMVLRNAVNQECLIWNQWDGSSDFPRAVRSIFAARSVARKVQINIIHVGAMNAPGPGDGKAYFAIGGKETRLSDAEILSAHPNCSFAWMPYTVGDPFPKRAIATGSINRRVTYSIRVGSSSAESFGFFRQGDTVGHYTYFGYHLVLDFHVLVCV